MNHVNLHEHLWLDVIILRRNFNIRTFPFGLFFYALKMWYFKKCWLIKLVFFIFSPCILIFDSLAGASRSRVVATLRDYLSCEYQKKIGGENTFTKDTIKGACPKVPQQSNFTDCGLYVLQYVESFFKVS